MNYYADGGMTAQEMPASQIIMNDVHSKAAGAENVVMGINELVQSGKGVLIQKNNSIILLISIGDGEVEIHLYTVDPPQRLASAMKYFHDELVRSGIHTVYGREMPNKQLIKLMLAVGIPVDKSDKPDYYWMANVR
jgi:hypothetical protein